jgi:hypothetical protein
MEAICLIAAMDVHEQLVLKRGKVYSSLELAYLSNLNDRRAAQIK